MHEHVKCQDRSDAAVKEIQLSLRKAKTGFKEKKGAAENYGGALFPTLYGILRK